ncbi:hypothetical protein GCM10010531_26050 [Blastococcus jejuensis]|uniref:DUF308 domain-containing protein n=1 Tax=Blastococcus jejuensis TaxID=351224 RepID=A0ABP6P9R1_9ACTN
MTGARRGRGRRDNGLDAVLWSPLRDVDPRIGEHLLDVLHAVGIAAYLEPSADVGPYTRTVFLPSPPTDRLFVDRSRRAEARTLVEEQVGREGADRRPDPVPERAALRRDLDEDAEWAAIVSAFEAEHGRAVAAEEPAQAPPPAPHEPAVLDRPDEHYEPPPPPPVPVPAPASLYAVLVVLGGVLLVFAPGLLRLSADVGLVLGVAAIAAGVALLVMRMRDRSLEDDGDDGAVV